QAEAAIRQADVVIFVTSARDGPLGPEVSISDQLRRSEKPVLLTVNKADSPGDRLRATDFWELGLDEPHCISSTQGTGIGDLLDLVAERLPPPVETEAVDEDEVSVAIVGRPNVGKSSLLNAIVGEERAIVNEMAGTTRDAVDTPMERDGKRLLLIDTAGIRRRGRVSRGVETYSVLRAMRAIERAEVAVVVIDADDGVTAQDTHVAGYVHEAAKGCIIAVNKWDLVPRSPDAGAKYLAATRRDLAFLDYAPVVFISAKSGLNVGKMLDRVLAVAEERKRRIPTAQVNELVRQALAAHPHTERGKLLKVLYVTQASTNPPTFVFFVNDPELVHFSYRRYLENQIRRAFGFDGTGIRTVFRGRGDE
ncbi:MAG: small GTP-binding protein, partial [Chloroflexi bacterium]|nr:small GTP-binding protein [Chloroflexota bacterium]